LFADRFGVAAYGAISGVLALLLTAARAIMPLAVEVVRPSVGSYQPIYVVVGLVTALGALVILLVVPHKVTT
jgi:hypothetical protein